MATMVMKEDAQAFCIEKSTNGKYLVIAGPGTGKTYTITKKIKHMIEEEHISPSEILCLTYTETGAKEMKNRVGEQYDIDVFTYHAFCMNIVQEYNEHFNLENTRVINDDDKRTLISKCIDKVQPENYDYSDIKDILDGIDEIEKNRITKDKFFYNLDNHPFWKPHLKELIAKEADDIKAEIEKRTAKIQSQQEKINALYFKKEQGALSIKDANILEGREKELDDLINKKIKSGVTEEKEKLEYKIKRMYELWDLYEEYKIQKKEYDYIDYNDMINLVLDKFKNEESGLLSEVNSKYKYIIVDEYQDTNHSQNEIIFELAKNSPNVYVVGDDDQIIFTFQGASVDTLSKFKDKFEPVVKCYTYNWRSTQQILDVSKCLAELQDDEYYNFFADKNKNLKSEELRKDYIDYANSNKGIKLRFLSKYDDINDSDGNKIEKVLLSHEEANYHNKNNPVELINFETPSAERDYIINKIISLKNEFDEYNKNLAEGEESKKYSEIAVLTYSNEALKEYEAYLKASGVPVQVGSKNIFEINSVKALVSYLQFLSNPEKYSDKMLCYLLYNPFHIDSRDYLNISQNLPRNKSIIDEVERLLEKGLSENEFKEKLNKIVEYGHKKSVIEGVKSIVNKDEEIIYGRKNLEKFISDFNYLNIYKTSENYKTTILEVLHRTGMYEEFFIKDIANKYDNMKGIQKFLELADAFFEVSDNKNSSFDAFVNYIGKMYDNGAEIKLDKEEKPINAIQLSTYHSSKGREFEYVFMPNIVSKNWDEMKISDENIIPKNFQDGDTYKSILDKLYQKCYLDKLKLLYVGMTRAKHTLTLSYSGEKPSWFIEKLSMKADKINKEKEQNGENSILHFSKLLDMDIKIELPKSQYSFENEFKNNLEPLIANRFAFSSLNVYKKCPKQYFYKYILNMNVLSDNQDDYSYGSAVHKFLENVVIYLMDNKKYPTKDKAEQMLYSEIDKLILSDPNSEKIKATENILSENGFYNEYKKLANPEQLDKDKKFEKTAVLTNEATGKRTIYSEFSFNYEMDMPDSWKTSLDDKDAKIVLYGSIDRLDKDVDGEYIIYDYKTKPEGEDITPSNNYFIQMCLYKYALEHQFPGIHVKEAYFVFPIANNEYYLSPVHKKFEKIKLTTGEKIDEYGNTIKSMMEMIGNIRQMNFMETNKSACTFCPYTNFCRSKTIC